MSVLSDTENIESYPGKIKARSDAADVAHRLHAFIARHDAERRANARLIRLLIARNMWLGQVVGRLRRDCARLEWKRAA